jgi:hypothetical protein
VKFLSANNKNQETSQYLSLEEGKRLVALARQAISCYLENGTRIKPPDIPERLKQKSGVFVTLNTLPRRELRGCIGFPYPESPLADATINAAIYAATEDPRFEPVSKIELKKIALEVTVLTVPRTIAAQDPKELPQSVIVGRHGLIVEAQGMSGLLLPQVATEWNWDSTEFLMNCCIKANLPPDAWLLKSTKVMVFEGQIFEEIEPDGAVRKKTATK